MGGANHEEHHLVAGVDTDGHQGEDATLFEGSRRRGPRDNQGDAENEHELDSSDGASVSSARPQKKGKLWFHNSHMKRRMKKAAKARQELYDTFRFSDAWLLGTIVFFSLLGNTYKIKEQYEIYIGVCMFLLSYLVYVVIKTMENRKLKKQKEEDRRRKALEEQFENEEAATSAREGTPLQESPE
mmetsp:Transcript_130376/g.260072  ORF Transcript_130376/g.260072 Transcript_130376/m.260072 type:complete len:185 (-) Transcript_130376:94-648(-)|eukprot:CAMPEP_0172843780 /NCGR_PEP_ID=MMETSP1075-20121228/31722_1 /TAXON_ID=2916 /ORGANISM="Ceratium fusus, Strain PA161109" /LENGTH=184 /DNA_ID=CAMNT_0013688105 /DNA_START=39 /DNA_END=593 /DNA_ORIENTATION=-